MKLKPTLAIAFFAMAALSSVSASSEENCRHCTHYTPDVRDYMPGNIFVVASAPSEVRGINLKQVFVKRVSDNYIFLALTQKNFSQNQRVCIKDFRYEYNGLQFVRSGFLFAVGCIQ
jgi:hypothetical protein